MRVMVPLVRSEVPTLSKERSGSGKLVKILITISFYPKTGAICLILSLNALLTLTTNKN